MAVGTKGVKSMVRETLQHELTAALDAGGCQSQVELILFNAVECAHFYNSNYEPVENAALGSSRIGGLPDLPRNAAWPTGVCPDGGAPGTLARFIAQINLEDVPPFEGSPFPQQGYFWLFARSWDKCLDLPLMGLYARPLEGLEKRVAPSNVHKVTSSPSMPIHFKIGYSLPWHRKSFRHAIGDDYDAYRCRQALSKMNNGEPIQRGTIGGYAQFSEAFDVYRWTALSRIGRLDLYDAAKFDSLEEYRNTVEQLRAKREERRNSNVPKGFWPVEKYEAIYEKVVWIDQHRAEVAAAMESWKLLLSIDDNHQVGISVGDATALDVFIQASDAKIAKFDELVGQMPQVL